MTSRVEPRYDATTWGWFRTSSQSPSTTTRPRSQAMMRSDTRADERHVVLDEQDARAGDVADAEEQRAERFGLALRDTRRRLVEQDHLRLDPDLAREVDDAAAPGGEVGHELVAVVVEAHHRDELVGPLPEPALGEHDVREVEHRRDRVPELDGPVERDADRLVHGERAEQAGVLERAREPERRTALAAPRPGRAGGARSPRRSTAPAH